MKCDSSFSGRVHPKSKVLFSVLVLISSLSLSGQGNVLPFRDTNLSVNERVNDLISRLTIDEKAGLLWELSPGVGRLGIDKYYHGNEALHGVVRPGRFTVFPQAIAFGATFNPDLIFEVSTAISDEARGRWNELNFGKDQKQNHSDLLTFWSPTVNMARDPRWGRTAETYGEDPYLTSRIGVSFVKGLQGDHPNYLKTVSTPKHFVANNVENNRFSANSVISERTLREYYLPAFKACITEGRAEAIMSAYNALNGVPSTANRWLLNDLLRKEWGFEGYVVSDCGAPMLLKNAHKFVLEAEDAAAASIRAGMDLECNGGGYIIRDYLVEALEEGKITNEEIDYALANVLRAKFRLGIFDPLENNPYNSIVPEVVGQKKHQDLALQTSLESIVLLKNEKEVLPLKRKDIKSIALVGHNVNQMIYGDYSGEPINSPVTALEGIRGRAGEKIKINVAESRLRTNDLTMIPNRYLETLEGRNGLTASYFTNKALDGSFRSRIDPQVNIHNRDNPPDPFLTEGPKSVRWEGSIEAPATGTYKIGVSSDDGFRLWIEDSLVLDHWIDQGETLYSIQRSFEAKRKYRVRLEWYDGGGDYVCRLQWKVPGEKADAYQEEVQAARSSDVVVAVIGTGLYNEREGWDKENLSLPGDQVEMLRAVYDVNKNMVVVLITGSQHTIPWIKENIPAIINAWYPGEQGGNAIAKVLFGDYNPAGRLPLTYYESVEKLPDMERYEISEGRTYMYYKGTPLWEFGHGLSYTKFKYSDLKIADKQDSNGKVEISFTVENVGKMDGDEVSQLYLSFPDSKVDRPIKQLKRFKRLAIKKGASKGVKFFLDEKDLAYWSVMKQDWSVEKGAVQVKIGSSSNDIRLEGAFKVE